MLAALLPNTLVRRVTPRTPQPRATLADFDVVRAAAEALGITEPLG